MTVWQQVCQVSFKVIVNPNLELLLKTVSITQKPVAACIPVSYCSKESAVSLFVVAVLMSEEAKLLLKTAKAAIGAKDYAAALQAAEVHCIQRA
jgi:hypothetical protein